MVDHNIANVERFSGFADKYDHYRPQPPLVLLDILTQLAQIEQPRVVVDLGSGTALSTLIWAGRAAQVIGIEPNADMRVQAEVRAGLNGNPANVRFANGLSTQTNLPDACADIVTCSQSLHWMEPEPTFTEIARVLRAGGVFAAIDCDWPPTVNVDAEIAYNTFVDRAEAIGKAREWYAGVQKLKKEDHLKRIRASQKFRYVNELVIHNVEQGDAERLVQLALSQGGVATLFKRGMSEADAGVPEFRDAVRRAFGDRATNFYFSYRVRIGIK
ncbi:MAG: class I SAM-dependent methyltransferase [Chloroflexi bacterium]|nr:class I SAM-dependent methyltransferase [Chloroflexota bacterium]